MSDIKLSFDVTDQQIKKLLLLMKKEPDLGSELKPLYDTLLDYVYTIMTIEEAEQFFNEN